MEQRRVDIPPNTNLNRPPATAVKLPDLLSPDLIDLLPDILKQGVNALVEDNDKRVFLVSALAVLSGVLPKFGGTYDGKPLSPNLYAFIVGDYGTGKGAAEFARKLVAPIEDYLERQNQTALDLYAGEVEEWKATPKAVRGEPPVRPKRVGLVIPANSSASAFTQQLSEYGGRGILFETEGDTLTQTLNTDHGNYSDVLRKCFHHETVSMSRRANDESIMLKGPELSVLLTGTPDQLRNLIPDTANGLFSRFLYLTIQAEAEFRDVFAPDKAKYGATFETLGKWVFALYERLNRRAKPLTFTFHEDQKADFVATYRAGKRGFIDATGTEATGTYNRLAVINFRLAMTLAALRWGEDKHEFSTSAMSSIYCSAKDYAAAKQITAILTDQALRVYYGMPDTVTPEEEDTAAAADPKLAEGGEAVKDGLSIRKAARQVGVSKSRLGRYCQSRGIVSGQRGGRGA